jgi:hypothetical protein
MSTLPPYDAAPAGGSDLDSLDVVFDLPDTITDDRIRSMYEVLVHRMRREAANLPMTTTQHLLIERICTIYVSIRQRESGAAAEFLSASDQKSINAFWLSLVAEFNKILKAPEADMKKALIKDVGFAIKRAINSTLEDPARRVLTEKISNALDAIGV